MKLKYYMVTSLCGSINNPLTYLNSALSPVQRLESGLSGNKSMATITSTPSGSEFAVSDYSAPTPGQIMPYQFGLDIEQDDVFNLIDEDMSSIYQ